MTPGDERRTMPESNAHIIAAARDHHESAALQPRLRAPEVEETVRSLPDEPELRFAEAVEREVADGSERSRQVTDLALELLLRGVDRATRPNPELQAVFRRVIEARGGEPAAVAEKTVGGLASARLTVANATQLQGSLAHLEAAVGGPSLGGAAHPARPLLPARSARLEASALHDDALAAVFEDGGWTGRFARARVARGASLDLPDLARHRITTGESAFLAQAGKQPFAFDFVDFLQDIDTMIGGVLDDASRSAGFAITLRDRIKTPFGVCATGTTVRLPCLRILLPLAVASPIGLITTDINLYIGAGLRHGAPALDLVRLAAWVPASFFQPVIQALLDGLLAPGGAAWNSAAAVIQNVTTPLRALRNLQLCTIAPLLIGTRAVASSGHSDDGAQLLMSA